MMFFSMVRPTNNEINNLIYMFLKYSMRFDDPNNSDIATIMLGIEEATDKDEIINKTIEFVKNKYGEAVVGIDTFHIERHMQYIYNEFFELPFNLRDDLGEDKNAEEFVVKH